MSALNLLIAQGRHTKGINPLATRASVQSIEGQKTQNVLLRQTEQSNQRNLDNFDANAGTRADERNRKSIINGAIRVKPFTDSDDPLGALREMNKRRDELLRPKSEGGHGRNFEDLEQTNEAIKMIENHLAGARDPETGEYLDNTTWNQFKEFTDSIVQQGRQQGRQQGSQFGAGKKVIGITESGKRINGVVEIERDPNTGQSVSRFLPDVGQLDPNDPIIRTENVGTLGSTFEQQELIRTRELEERNRTAAKIETEEKAEQKKQALTIEREQNFIGEAIEVGDALPDVRRALELLQEVETGGYEAVRIRAHQFLGVETADEGELVSLLGTAVLSRLRDTFGAQFTEKEGDRLIDISARMGANTQTNIRLLERTIKRMERQITRGLRFAEKYEDADSVALINEVLSLGRPEQEPGADFEGRRVIGPDGSIYVIQNGELVKVGDAR